MDRVVTAILGGGQGSRLWPLTRDRAKPAVPLASKYRLIDIPISNSLHAGIDRIYVLTQFNSGSLHRHIAQTYRFDSFSKGFVNILAATQSLDNRSWYQGTADAVRQNLDRLVYAGPSEVLILSGDQLYLMDMRAFVSRHRAVDADLTAVPRSEAGDFGIMKVDAEGRVIDFVEKPQDEADVDELVVPTPTLVQLGLEPRPDACLASMGIYVFKPEVLLELLQGTTATDFGHEVIPSAVPELRVFAFGYAGYWRDIGTIDTFHQANLELARPVPPLDLYDPNSPIYTHPRFLPPTKVSACEVRDSMISEGCILSGASIRESVIGVRSLVRAGAVIEQSVIMGANSYEWISSDPAKPPLGIGRDCVIRRAIIDLDTRIGEGTKLINADGVQQADHDDYCIRKGIIVVPRGSMLQPGTVV